MGGGDEVMSANRISSIGTDDGIVKERCAVAHGDRLRRTASADSRDGITATNLPISTAESSPEIPVGAVAIAQPACKAASEVTSCGRAWAGEFRSDRSFCHSDTDVPLLDDPRSQYPEPRELV
jgi:hypothetical protein